MGAIIKNGVLYTGGSSGSNQQADFAETDTTSPAYIKHKPTALSDFTNDSGFITNTVNNLINYYAKTESYTKTEVDTMISAIKSGRFIYVATLPATDIHTDAIYLVPKTISQEDNIKDEYINLDGTITGWEKIGDTKIDLSNYVQKSQTAGLIKNDGTVDTNTYATTATLNDKVDKVSGKGLSTNDYTTAEQTKLAGVTTGANRIVKTEYTLNSNSWSSSSVALYEQRFLTNPMLDANYPVNVYLGTNSLDPFPDESEIVAYNDYILGGLLETTSVDPTSYLTIYASDIPSYRGTPITLKIWVEGVLKEVD